MHFQGTVVILENVKKDDIEKAKSLFLTFSGNTLLENFITKADHDEKWSMFMRPDLIFL